MLEFAWERELVHLRYELRGLLAEGRREEAAPLLERLRQLAQKSVGAASTPSAVSAVSGIGPSDAAPPACQDTRLEPEIARWASKFDL
jgi:hypothetical protein